ncbi:MAG: hypothetical protein JNL80_12570 [Phycisphaerae bacterium]|nr:hypothetical protein [Phycisphaerae bacterium]
MRERLLSPRHHLARIASARLVLWASIASASVLASPLLMSTTFGQEAAPSVDPSETAAEVTAESGTIAHIPSGGCMRLPRGWTSSEGSAGVLMLAPSSADQAAHPGLVGMFGCEPWDVTVRLGDEATVARLREQYLAVMPGFSADGPPRSEGDALRMEFSNANDSGVEVRLHVFARAIGDRLLTIAVAGPASVMRDRSSDWELMFASATAGDQPNTSPASLRADGRAADTMTELVHDLGGYAIRYPKTWSRTTEGSAALLTPDGPNAGSPMAEMYAINSMPWTAGRTLDDPATAEQAAAELLADAPRLHREGKLEPLPGGGVLMRCSGRGDDGADLRLSILARNGDRRVVAIVTSGDATTVAARERQAKELLATLRFVEPKDASPLPAHLDREVIGRWSSDEILSSGSGFDSFGTTSLVTQRILDLGADGTFSRGSRSAGGNAGVSIDSPFEVTARGTWRVERSGESNYIVFSTSDGSTERARFVMHEGQLVFGQSGSRKFYSRIR